MRERSLSEETGIGTLLSPKGVSAWGCRRLAGQATMRCCGCVWGSSSEVRALLLPAQLLNLEVINRSRVLHPIQRLHVSCVAGPRGV